MPPKKINVSDIEMYVTDEGGNKIKVDEISEVKLSHIENNDNNFIPKKISGKIMIKINPPYRKREKVRMRSAVKNHFGRGWKKHYWRIKGIRDLMRWGI